MGPPESLSDEQLVTRVCAGRLEFFETLVDRHLLPIRVFAAYHSPALDLVDGITRETFVFALKNIHLFKSGTEFRGWLRAVALNLVRAELQRARADHADRFTEKRIAELERVECNPYDVCESEFIEGCSRQLPESLRVLLKQRYREDKSTGKIALSLGRSVTSVRLALFRLRQELGGCIQLKQREAANAR